MLQVFSWDRCPDCIKVKVLLGLKNIAYNVIIMTTERQADVEHILGKICVPAIALPNNILIDDTIESLKLLDENTGNNTLIVSKSQDHKIDEWLANFLETEVWQQLMAPRWFKLGMREFTQDPELYRNYVANRTQESLDQWLQDTPQLLTKLMNQLNILNEFIQPITTTKNISISELNLFARLIYLTGVKGAIHTENGLNPNFPQNVKKFIATTKQQSQINCYGSQAI